MKNIQSTIVAVTCLIMVACLNGNNDSENKTERTTTKQTFNLPDSLSSRRISFVLKLREAVANTYWTEFGEKSVEGTFIYFNGDHSEIFFPSDLVLNKIKNFKRHSNDYVLSQRTDSIPYHFELMISFDPADSTRFYFDHPIQQFLSVEETETYIPSVQSTEMWSTMVVHEMFHHFQYNNPVFKEYAKLKIGSLPFDIRNLAQLCREDEVFFVLIQQENKYLMEAIAEEDPNTRDSIIEKYLRARNQRIAKYSLEYPHLEVVENFYILQEGSARYIEYQSMNSLNEFYHQENAPQIKDDPRFNSFKEFKTIDLSADEFNYLTYTGETDYHYTLGFNTMRLLDKLGVEYKKNLFDNQGKALYKYLEEYIINALPNKQ